MRVFLWIHACISLDPCVYPLIHSFIFFLWNLRNKSMRESIPQTVLFIFQIREI
jgi:hypothetical protein